MTMLWVGDMTCGRYHATQHLKRSVHSQTICTDIVIRKHETLTDHGSGPVHTGTGIQSTAMGSFVPQIVCLGIGHPKLNETCIGSRHVISACAVLCLRTELGINHF